jgi:hypothetical protein
MAHFHPQTTMDPRQKNDVAYLSARKTRLFAQTVFNTLCRSLILSTASLIFRMMDSDHPQYIGFNHQPTNDFFHIHHLF